ncbi:MinD/ParA family ATP-binding protein [Mycobacteroides abscessus]|uniref:MinD/ParA family ATP-binding protein n=1 Tax=Mycobacteroides abscessus TaxID=36809 RepID=UPI000AF80EB6|nr:MinD/ParA family protein [Mycobacteroides abscessus]
MEKEIVVSAPNDSVADGSEDEILDRTGPIIPIKLGAHAKRQRAEAAAQQQQQTQPEPLPSQLPPRGPLSIVDAVPPHDPLVDLPPAIGDALGAQLRSEILPPLRRPASAGWRKWVYRGSFGVINPGESREEAELRELTAVVRSPWRGIHSLAVLGGNGGVGKTMITAALGSVLFELRRKDMVLATDADPGQSANLASWIDPSASSTFADVLAQHEPERNFDLRFFVGQNSETGLDVLAANSHSVRPRGELNAEIYTQAHHRLQRLYSLLITDTGVDFWHPVMPGVLRCANGVVLVAAATPVGAEGAVRAIEWLIAEGYEHLIPRMVVVINHVRGYDNREDRRNSERLVAAMVARFHRWISPNHIVAVPYDPHIATAGPLDIQQLQPETWHGLLTAAASVSAGLASAWSV